METQYWPPQGAASARRPRTGSKRSASTSSAARTTSSSSSAPVEGRDVEPEEQFSVQVRRSPSPTSRPSTRPGARRRRPAPKRRAKGKRSEESGRRRIGRCSGLLTEALGSGSVRLRGQPPRWLREGIGTYMASMVEPRSPYYQQLRQTAFANFDQGWQTKASEALGGTDQITARPPRRQLRPGGVHDEVASSVRASPPSSTACSRARGNSMSAQEGL